MTSVSLSAQSTTTLSSSPQTIFEVKEMMDARAEADRLTNTYFLCDFSPTGFYAFSGTTLVIQVELLEGSRLPHLLIGTYSRHKNVQVTNIPLVQGKNEISVPADGLVWLRYTNKNPNSSARISFESGYEVAPYFVAGKTPTSAWRTMINTHSKSPDVLLQGGKCMMVLGREDALKYADEDQNQILDWLNKVVSIEDNISGLDGSSPQDIPNAHHYLLTEHDEGQGYFFATSYVTAFSSGGLRYITTLNGIKEGGWGCWHELGHLHQQSWTWEQITEVSVNIFTMAVERNFIPEREKRRLVKDGIWGKAMQYLARPDDKKNYNEDHPVNSPYPYAPTIFQRLCMFQQLYLAFGEKFYQQLFKQTRRDLPSFAKGDNDAKITYFVLSACKVSGKRLDSFFKTWGIRLSSPEKTEQLYKDILALGLPLPDMDISKLSD